jgi:hypothetical protein
LSRPTPAAHGQARIVRAYRFRANENCVYTSSKPVRVAPRGRIRDPARLARRPRQATIQRHSALRDHERLSRDNPFIESLVNLRALIAQNVFSHFDARIAQLLDAFAGVARIYVTRADNYAFDSSLDYRVCAWSSAPGRGARLQSNVQCSASRHTRTEITKALNLGVIATRCAMTTFGYYSIVND